MALHATGKPLVVVLMNGSCLVINWADKNAAAILEAWYPGEEGGHAIAETLKGANNPGGRLPVTFYTGLDQLPSFSDYSMKERTYRYFHGKPLYSFGFGLSYARFVYSNVQLGTRSLDPGKSQGVDVNVRNASAVGGDEVTQVYLTFPAVKGAPIKALRGFARVYIPAGETKHLHFTLSSFDISVVNESGVRMIPRGEYRLSVGGSQPRSPLDGTAFFVKHQILLSDEGVRTPRH